MITWIINARRLSCKGWRHPVRAASPDRNQDGGFQWYEVQSDWVSQPGNRGDQAADGRLDHQFTKTWDWVSVADLSGGLRFLCPAQRQPRQSGHSVRLSLEQTEAEQQKGKESRRWERGRVWNIFTFQASSLGLYLLCVQRTLEAALCLKNFSSQKVERHNKPEIEIRESQELLLNPVIVSRNEKERVLIEPSINSVRWIKIFDW